MSETRRRQLMRLLGASSVALLATLAAAPAQAQNRSERDHVRQGHRANLSREVRDLPPCRGHGADVARDLQRCTAVGPIDQAQGRRARHAAVVRGQDRRHPEVRQRPVAVRPRDRPHLAMGRRRRAAGESARSAQAQSLAGRRCVAVRRVLRTSTRPRREVARLLDASRVAGPVVGGARHARYS